MAILSRGYLVPSDESLVVGPWTITVAHGRAIEAVDAIPEWDYFTPIRLDRELTVDLRRLKREAALARDARVGAVVIWQSSWTGLRGSSEPVTLNEGSNLISLSLEGSHLGGKLALEGRIIVIDPGERPGPLTARRRGSVLWGDVHRLDLEGTGSRFPTVPVPFSSTGIAGGRRGAWALMIDTDDLSSSALGCLRVYLNAEHPRVADLLADPESESSVHLLRMIHYDVARQLFHYALAHDEFAVDGDYAEATLGAVLARMVRLMARPLGELRARKQSEPGDLEAEFQAVTGLMD